MHRLLEENGEYWNADLCRYVFINQEQFLDSHNDIFNCIVTFPDCFQKIEMKNDQFNKINNRERNWKTKLNKEQNPNLDFSELLKLALLAFLCNFKWE